MTDHIGELVHNITESERFRTMVFRLDSVLSFAYGRATGQNSTPEEYAFKFEGLDGKGISLAQYFLLSAEYIQEDENGILITTIKGNEFMEKHYGGTELFEVKIKNP